VPSSQARDEGAQPLVPPTSRTTNPLGWFQKRLWRLKWLECILLSWLSIAFGAYGQPHAVELSQIVGMVVVSPVVGLLFYGVLRASAFVMIITSAPLMSVVVRKLIEYHDKMLSTFCHEAITFGKTY
jgi:hypothetical protein